MIILPNLIFICKIVYFNHDFVWIKIKAIAHHPSWYILIHMAVFPASSNIINIKKKNCQLDGDSTEGPTFHFSSLKIVWLCICTSKIFIYPVLPVFICKIVYFNPHFLWIEIKVHPSWYILIHMAVFPASLNIMNIVSPKCY